MKDQGDITNQQLGEFQSPCGEEVMKGNVDLAREYMGELKFQSPCGEEVMKAELAEVPMHEPVAVSVPLRGRGNERFSPVSIVDLLVTMFQSPCGEEVMKESVNWRFSDRVRSMFQSPCGEEVMKEDYGRFSVMHGVTLFQSPCGEEVMKEEGKRRREQKESVSVPLRGRGDERGGQELLLYESKGRFQSPCGEEVMKGAEKLK